MNEANVQLVIPRPLIGKFPNAVQPHLLRLESFIADVRLLTLSKEKPSSTWRLQFRSRALMHARTDYLSQHA